MSGTTCAATSSATAFGTAMTPLSRPAPKPGASRWTIPTGSGRSQPAAGRVSVSRRAGITLGLAAMLGSHAVDPPECQKAREGGCRRGNGKDAAAAVLDPIVGVILGRAALQRALRLGGGEGRLRGGQQ